MFQSPSALSSQALLLFPWKLAFWYPEFSLKLTSTHKNLILRYLLSGRRASPANKRFSVLFPPSHTHTHTEVEISRKKKSKKCTEVKVLFVLPWYFCSYLISSLLQNASSFEMLAIRLYYSISSLVVLISGILFITSIIQWWFLFIAYCTTIYNGGSHHP